MVYKMTISLRGHYSRFGVYCPPWVSPLNQLSLPSLRGQ